MSAVKLAERLGYMPILNGDTVGIDRSDRGVIGRLVADIDAAQHHVHLLFYIFANDSTGRRMADAFYRAVGRGVKCRVLADGVGSAPGFNELGKEMIRPGCGPARGPARGPVPAGAWPGWTSGITARWR